MKNHQENTWCWSLAVGVHVGVRRLCGDDPYIQTAIVKVN